MNISFIIIQFRGINLNKAIFEKEGYQTENGEPESFFIHSTRITLLILGSMVSFSVFVIICSIILFVITVGVLSSQGRLGENDELNYRSRNLIRNMRHFPFGDILFKETSECAICLDSFNQRVEIVQLKCSKYHIFHLHCVKNLLNHEQYHHHVCPLCRQRIEI
jgi:hypothetical protein